MDLSYKSKDDDAPDAADCANPDCDNRLILCSRKRSEWRRGKRNFCCCRKCVAVLRYGPKTKGQTDGTDKNSTAPD
jgi:hypothetical protein